MQGLGLGLRVLLTLVDLPVAAGSEPLSHHHVSGFEVHVAASDLVYRFPQLLSPTKQLYVWESIGICGYASGRTKVILTA